ncbi:extracellular matrix protein 1 [Sardina pilchardus]|uniref:extracellular matrix protein 1 n=1 Tax=Sardina pilchardus TaxID=27697 RepID=UPI002E15E8C9
MAQTKMLGHMLVVIWLGVSASASSDAEDMGQREATFDLSELLGQAGHSDPNPDMSQREVTFDLADIWGLEDTDDLMQKEVTVALPDFLKEKISNYSGPDITQREITDEFEVDLPPRGPAQFGPRGYAPHPRIEFPPGRPTSENIQAICLYGTGRPRYPQDLLPRTGLTYLGRQADAIHRTEAWYSQQCCQGSWQQNIDRTLCCAHQAWKKALEEFCNDEFSVKTRHYHCCRLNGHARLNCFQREAPNPSYKSTTRYTGPELLPRGSAFTFTNNCKRHNTRQSAAAAAAAPRTLRGEKTIVPDISFPPGRPTSSNIKWVCKLRKLRPRYVTSCLPRGGYGWLARQSKAFNRLERGLKRCCKGKKEVLACADEKWREEMNRFCQEEHGVKTKHHACCRLAEGEERLSCFSSKAPHPHYQAEMMSMMIQTPPFPQLKLVCETHKILKKLQNNVPVASVVKKCCHLVPEQRHACLQDTLDSLQREKCSEEPPSPMVTPDCCGPNPSKCFSDLLLESITKAMETPSFRRRRCPLYQ